MKKQHSYWTALAIALCSGCFLFYTSNGTNETPVSQHIYIPNNLDFAQEKVPVSLADVRERLDKELSINVNLHATTALIIKRANRIFPIIEPILAKNNIPDDFKYLAVIESGLVNAVSPAGARGVWQFMPETGKSYGLEISEEIDERYHLEKATQAACDYLNKVKNKLGSWTLAAAAYNAGINGINRQLQSQKVTDYYDLLLNEETSRYVFRIVALKEIMQNPQKYGYQLPKEVLYQPISYKTIDVKSKITDLASFAQEQGINYKILKLHNPWLRDQKLNADSTKVYQLQIPTEGYHKN